MSVAEKRIVQSGNNVTIAENVLKVYAAGQKSVGVRETVSGNPAVLDYVHTANKELEVQVEAKNLFTGELLRGAVSTSGAVVTEGITEFFYTIAKVEPNTLYSLEISSSAPDTKILMLVFRDASGQMVDYNGSPSTKLSFTTTADTADVGITIRCPSGQNDVTDVQIKKSVSVAGTTLSVCGKNLMSDDTMISHGWTPQEDGSFYIATAYTVFNDIIYQGNGQAGAVTVSYDYKFAVIDKRGVYPYIYYTDGTSERITPAHTTEYNHYSVSTKPNKTIDHIQWSYGSSGFGNWVKNIQVELGSAETEYQPYQVTEYTVGDDNKVSGVKPVYPTTIMQHGDNGVNITTEYYLDAQSKIDDMEQTLVTLGGEL